MMERGRQDLVEVSGVDGAIEDFGLLQVSLIQMGMLARRVAFLPTKEGLGMDAWCS